MEENEGRCGSQDDSKQDTLGGNVTYSKKVEEALRRSEENYRAMFENVNDVIAKLDKYGTVLDINSRVKAVLGYEREEIIERNFAKLGFLSIKDIPKYVKLFKDILNGRPLELTEIEVKHKDGHTAFLESNARIVRKDGKFDHIIVIIRDISERKKAEGAQSTSKGAIDAQAASKKTGESAQAGSKAAASAEAKAKDTAAASAEVAAEPKEEAKPEAKPAKTAKAKKK